VLARLSAEYFIGVSVADGGTLPGGKFLVGPHSHPLRPFPQGIVGIGGESVARDRASIGFAFILS
jgi:hypothetical protein